MQRLKKATRIIKWFMSTHGILVIGSKGHERATCLNWLEPFPNIEEYDSLIINMLSLSQEYYDKIEEKIKDMQESISSLIDTGREVFCIMADILTPTPPTPPSGSGIVYASVAAFEPVYSQPSNYNWLPASIYPDNKKSGTSILLKNDRYCKYFSFIENWRFEVYFRINGGVFNFKAPSNFLNELYPIATNKSGKIIAGSLVRANDRNKMLNNEPVGMIHILPPPKEALIHQSIESLIEITIGTPDKAEIPWRKAIDIIIDHTLKEKLQLKQKELECVQGEIQEIQQQINTYDGYRDLLTETGDPLERIVRKTLNDIGITTAPTKPGYPADLINDQVAVEITGIKGAVGADSNKVTQTGRFIQNYRKQEKVILIVNTYMNVEPKDRKGRLNFTPEMVAYLKSLSVSYLTTQTLFELWRKMVHGELGKEQVRNLIMSKIGEVTV